MSGLRVLAGLLLAGWIADALASPDRDVEAGIEAYEAQDYATALTHFEAAIERRGDRPELSFDRGLALLGAEELDKAQTAFERASEAEEASVRASAFYELGNLALDAEQWDVAIEHYVECLKARPDHANAKWNLEIALLRKREEEKEKEREEQEQDEQQEQDQEQQEQDEEQDEEQGQDTDGQPPPEQDTEGESTGGEQPEGEDTGGQDTGDQQPEQGTGGQQPEPQDGQQQPPEPEQQGQPPQQQPAKPLGEMDIDKALDELDEQDAFILDRPRSRTRPPKKDW